MIDLFTGIASLLDSAHATDEFSYLPPRQADIARLLDRYGPLKRRQIAALLGWDESNVGHHLERMAWDLKHEPYGLYALRTRRRA